MVDTIANDCLHRVPERPPFHRTRCVGVACTALPIRTRDAASTAVPDDNAAVVTAAEDEIETVVAGFTSQEQSSFDVLVLIEGVLTVTLPDGLLDLLHSRLLDILRVELVDQGTVDELRYRVVCFDHLTIEAIPVPFLIGTEASVGLLEISTPRFEANDRDVERAVDLCGQHQPKVKFA